MKIKELARQSFRDQQTQDTEGGVPDIVSYVAGYMAGYRHLEAQVKELREALDWATSNFIRDPDMMPMSVRDKLKDIRKRHGLDELNTPQGKGEGYEHLPG